MKNEEYAKNDITNITKRKSKNVTWIIIGGKKQWIRDCPCCNKKLLYNSRGSRNRSRRLNSLCKKCLGLKSRKCETPDILCRECPKCRKTIIYNDNNLNNRRHHYIRAVQEKRLCKSCNKKQNLNPMFRSKRYGKRNPMFGKKQSENAKQKMREIALQRIKNQHGVVSFNPKACEYFDKLSKEKGWKLQHAKNGGETECVGYSLDAYDKERNVVVEYDEPHHYTIYGNLKPKDKKRQRRIIKALKCRFFRFKETEQKLYRVI